VKPGDILLVNFDKENDKLFFSIKESASPQAV
jgi:hypothetical protein